jgi:LysR family nitrogen assimilation transcriptional regulator
VRLGVLPNFGGQFAVDLLLLCEKVFPNIKLLLFEGFSYQIAAWLQSKQIDLGFLYECDSYRQLNAEFQLREDVFLVGSPDGWPFGETVAFEALRDVRLITPAPPNATTRRLAAAASERGFELTIAYEIDSLVAIKHLLASNRGYGVFTRASISEDIQSGRLAAAKLTEPDLTFDMALASTDSTILPLSARRMVDLLRTVVSDNLAEGRWSGKFLPDNTRAFSTEDG